MKIGFTWSLLAAVVTIGPLAAAISQPVKVESGLVSGTPGKHPSVMVFKGIPYAAPPIGGLRWRAPQPVAVWQGIRPASQFGASCIQSIVAERKPWTYEFMTHGQISEDCLYLNVWTPAQSARERHPVLVWVHGGANTEGSAAVPVYDGDALAARGLVVVTINYRLGVFGFLAHPELTGESGYNASGNYALLDLVAALRWVRNNIAAFGGDPNRVTLAGQSAGASITHSLTASPLARGLFQRAIAESGSSVGGGPMGGRKLADQEQNGVKFAAAKGVKSLAELRAMSWQDLTAPVAGGGQSFRFSVVVDGYVLPASVGEIFAQGKQNDVPTLTGCNADEGGAEPQPAITADALLKQVRQRYGELADEFLKLYPFQTDEEARRVQNESARDQARVSMYLWAVNRARTARTRAYTYFWNHALPGPDAEKYGAFHTSEIPYVFSSLALSDRPFGMTDRRIADMMSSYWVHFAASGNPNGKGLPAWPSVTQKPETTMELGYKPVVIPVAGSQAKFELFRKYFAKTAAAARLL
jgi:para-nitrobenzyl esterase